MLKHVETMPHCEHLNQLESQNSMHLPFANIQFHEILVGFFGGPQLLETPGIQFALCLIAWSLARSPLLVENMLNPGLTIMETIVEVPKSKACIQHVPRRAKVELSLRLATHGILLAPEAAEECCRLLTKKMILRVHTRAHAEGGMAMFLGNVNIEEPAWLMGLQQNELFARFAFKALVS